MAINRVNFPTTPNPVSGDWALITELVSKGFQNINSPIQTDGSNVPQGATFQIGGVIYYADSDTAITGTLDAVVKLTPNVGDSGATCDAAFVVNLTGVTWNKIYNGYYDVSGNLYIFDEVQAILAGALSGGSSKFAELFNSTTDQRLKTTDSPTFNALTVSNDLTVNGEILTVPDYGAIGSLVIAASTSWAVGNEYLPNTTVAGSTLVRNTETGGNTLGSVNAQATSLVVEQGVETTLNLVGTWRLLTRVYRGATTGPYRPVGLLQRIL